MFNFGNFLFENFTDNEDSEALALIENELDSIAEEALTSGEYDDIEDNAPSMAVATLEASNTLYQLYYSTLASDIIIEQHRQRGETEKADALLEGVVGDFFETLKSAFQTLWGQITKFFAEAKKKLTEFFDMGAKFVAKNEGAIKKNASKLATLEYEGFKYNFKEFMPSPVMADIEKQITSVNADASKIVDALVKSGADKSGDAFQKEYDKYDNMTVEKLLTGDLKSSVSKYGSDIKDNASLKKGYRTFLRGGSEEKIKMKGNEGPSVDSMLGFVKNKSKTLSEMEKEYGRMKKTFATIIKGFNEASSKAKKLLDTKDRDRIGKIQQICSKASAGYKSFLSISTSLYAVYVEEVKAASAQSIGVLKKLLSSKSDKEDDKKEPTKEGSLLAHLMKKTAF